MKKFRHAIEKSSYPMYDIYNCTAGFVSPSGMLHAGGYLIPPPRHLYSQYQPTFMQSQLSQQGITHS